LKRPVRVGRGRLASPPLFHLVATSSSCELWNCGRELDDDDDDEDDDDDDVVVEVEVEVEVAVEELGSSLSLLCAALLLERL